MAHARIIHGEALESLHQLPGDSVDAIVTDPPYGLTSLPQAKVERTLAKWVSGERDFIPGGAGFMDRKWDRFVPPPALWVEALRVLKPGGFLVSFAGARTLDLMGISIRLAGFEVRDILAWIRADTFAKAPGMLRSGHEPIVMARKPLAGTVAENHARWGIGALNIDACIVPYRNAADETESKTKNAHGRFGTLSGGNAVFGDFGTRPRTDCDAPGRQPSNAILDPAAAALLDAQHPVGRSRSGRPRRAATHGNGWGATHTGREHDDIGGPSRFFTIADAADGFRYAGRANARERPVAPDGTKHQTVKPLSIMDWLVTLVCPPAGTILDMFAGSGTTLESALRCGFDCISIEGESSFIPLIEQRIERVAPPAA